MQFENSTRYLTITQMFNDQFKDSVSLGMEKCIIPYGELAILIANLKIPLAWEWSVTYSRKTECKFD